MSEFEAMWTRYRERTEAALEARLPSADETPHRLNQALRYSCLGAGKRLRAMLVYASGEMFGVELDQLDTPAAAVELIHAFSLVHDDLPAMDDDDLRRGRPTCHRAFDEATAVLAGDAAQTLAFETLSSDPNFDVPAERRLKMIAALSKATGTAGMAGGQSLDMQATNRLIDFTQLQTIHRMKTAALIQASCLMGGLTSTSISDDQLNMLEQYGSALGLAFQIVDDILDVTADSETLGKASGADEKMQKSTYVSILGMQKAQEELEIQYQQALESARILGDNSGMFRQLADFVVNRRY
ncbi:MAG: polyprenyl synthetase family protein [bacterium]